MIPGQVAVSARALHRVVTAIAADALLVPAKDVSVELTDDRGLLAVAVRGPLRVERLGAGAEQPGIFQECERARETIRSRTLAITGSEVRRVAVRITRARIPREEGSRVS